MANSKAFGSFFKHSWGISRTWYWFEKWRNEMYERNEPMRQRYKDRNRTEKFGWLFCNRSISFSLFILSSFALKLPFVRLCTLFICLCGFCLYMRTSYIIINLNNDLNCNLILMCHCYNLIIYISWAGWERSLSLLPSHFRLSIERTMCCACVIVTNAIIFFPSQNVSFQIQLLCCECGSPLSFSLMP